MRSPESALPGPLLEWTHALFQLFRAVLLPFSRLMGDVLPNKSERTSITNIHDSSCRPDALCLACALVLFAQHRFTAFKEKFGRWPGPDEELFFDGTRAEPTRARPDQIKRQILDAAETHDLQILPLLDFFGIPPDLD